MANKLSKTTIACVVLKILTLLILINSTFTQSYYGYDGCNINCKVNSRANFHDLKIKVQCAYPTSFVDDNYNLNDIINATCFSDQSIDISNDTYNTKVSFSNVNEFHSDYFCSNTYSVSYLNLNHNNLNNITTIGFGDYDCVSYDDTTCDIQLWTLTLNNNRLQILKNNSFCHLKMLLNLHLSKNELKTIEIDAFKSLNRVIFLYLDGNQLTQVPYLQHLASLRWLYISSNFITTIRNKDFINCTLLSTIVMSYNKITNVEDEAFNGLDKLRKLDLSHNQLTSLGTAFEKSSAFFLYLDANLLQTFNCSYNFSSNLKELYLSENWITDVKYAKPWSQLTQLRRIDLSKNKIRFLNNFSLLNTIESLDLSRNQIQRFSLKDIELTVKMSVHTMFPRFKVLDLSHNQLTFMASKTFDMLFNLRKLILSHNHFTQLPLKSITQRFALQTLHLNDNQLISYPVISLMKLPHFNELTVHNNNWSCNCSFIINFKNYLITHFKVVIDQNLIYCNYNNGSFASLPVRYYNTSQCIN